ncbi:hypothetical protein ACFVFS_20175 [Kitasatospora sp. NPDC057692]|uniref:hypothetical protein n=1 Tax=Kitasatospora sp. NPDC057692 TaxID=3346215 RepID=UPI00367646C7
MKNRAVPRPATALAICATAAVAVLALSAPAAHASYYSYSCRSLFVELGAEGELRITGSTCTLDRGDTNDSATEVTLLSDRGEVTFLCDGVETSADQKSLFAKGCRPGR